MKVNEDKLAQMKASRDQLSEELAREILRDAIEKSPGLAVRLGLKEWSRPPELSPPTVSPLAALIADRPTWDAREAFSLGFRMGWGLGKGTEKGIEKALKTAEATLRAINAKKKQREERDPVKGIVKQTFMRLGFKVPEVLKEGRHYQEFKRELGQLGIICQKPEWVERHGKAQWQYHFIHRADKTRNWNPLESSLETWLYAAPKPSPA